MATLLLYATLERGGLVLHWLCVLKACCMSCLHLFPCRNKYAIIAAKRIADPCVLVHYTKTQRRLWVSSVRAQTGYIGAVTRIHQDRRQLGRQGSSDNNNNQI